MYEPRAPNPNTIQTSWVVNGVMIQNGNELSLGDLHLKEKRNTIIAVVKDTTPLVRSIAVREKMSDSVTWVISVENTETKSATIAPADISPVSIFENGGLILRGLQNFPNSLRISMYSMQGKLIFSNNEQRAAMNSTSACYPISGIGSGVYVLFVQDLKLPGNTLRKAIIKR